MMQEQFYNLVHDVIENDLGDATQLEMFSLEGREMIANLFAREDIGIIDPVVSGDLDYGLSPDAMELIKQGVTFTSIIASFFSTYLELRRLREKKTESNIDEGAIAKKLAEELAAQSVPKDLTEKISQQSASRLHAIIENV